MTAFDVLFLIGSLTFINAIFFEWKTFAHFFDFMAVVAFLATMLFGLFILMGE